MKHKTVKWIVLVAVALLALVVLAACADKAEAGLTALPLAFGLAALSADRDTSRREGNTISLGVAASKVIYSGALVARDASGYATPGATATTLVGLGRAASQVDNSSGANGDQSVEVEKGVFRYANDGTDTVTAADIGNDCYIVDDQTVANTDGTGTRSVAGKVFDVDSDGVWVRFE